MEDLSECFTIGQIKKTNSCNSLFMFSNPLILHFVSSEGFLESTVYKVVIGM